MKRLKKLLALSLAGTMLLAALAGCGDGSKPTTDPGASTDPSAGGTPAAGADFVNKDTLTFVSHMASETFDCVAASLYDKNVLHQVCDTLTAFDEDGNIIPRLATSWEEVDDGKAYIFHLRDDVDFHDGTHFTADAVVYTIEKMQAVPTNAWLFNAIGSVEKIDDYTVKLVKGTAFCNMLNTVAEYPFIVSPTAYDKGDFGSHPVGTGAYVFQSQGADQYVRLTANPNYFGGEPYYKNLVIRPPLDSSTAVVALENGEVDVAIALAPTQMAVVQQAPTLTASISDAYSLKYVLMEGDPFQSDDNLRKAIYCAINRENAVIFNNEPEGTPVATDLFAKRIMGDLAGAVPIGGYDLEQAKEYLAQSDYDGSTLKITITQDMAAVAQSIQGDLAAISINTEIIQVDMNAYYASLGDGTCQITIVDLGTDYNGVEDMLNFFTSTAYYGPFVKVTPEYDQLLIDMKTVYDTAQRQEMAKQAIEMQLGFSNLVPMYEANFNYVYRTGLTGFSPISGGTYVYYLGNVKPAGVQ